MHSMSSKTEKQMLCNNNYLFDGAYFLLSVIVEGDESSHLRMANEPAVFFGYWPLLTALQSICSNPG